MVKLTLPRYWAPPSFVTVFTMPLSALPYSALKVPLTTESSWTAFVAISTLFELSYGLRMLTPLIVYWISFDRPPRICSSPPAPWVTPAWSDRTPATLSTGRVLICSALTFVCDEVRSLRTMGASAWTSTVSRAITSVERRTSRDVVKSTVTLTLTTRFFWYPTPEATTE